MHCILDSNWFYSCYTFRADPDEQALDDINRFLYMSPDKRNIGNETRWMEKLKIHLIKQNREKEAKRLVELYQKLKGMVKSFAHIINYLLITPS